MTLSEWYSSKSCFGCTNLIEHDKKKHIRVYYCETCKKHAHRDISAAIIHLKIADCEVEGVRRAHYPSNKEMRPFKVTHERKYSETDVVKFYRPLIYLHEKMLKPVKPPKQQEQQKQQQQNPSSSSSIVEGMLMIKYLLINN